MSLLTQLGEAERLDDVIEGLLRILVEDPHGLSGIDGRAAADGDNPVGLELAHGLGALRMTVSMDGSDSTPSNSLTSMPASLRSASTSCKEPAAAHRAAARNDDGLLALEVSSPRDERPPPKYRSRGLVKRPILCLPKQAPLRLAYITEHPIGSVRTVLRVAGDDNARCPTNVSTLRRSSILPFWLVSYSPKATNDETFFSIPGTSCDAVIVPSWANVLSKVGHMPQAASRRSKRIPFAAKYRPFAAP